MPTYDYQCRSCGNRTEIIHSMLEDGPTSCELCKGPLRRVVHPAGIIFRGSGFYATDSRASRANATSSSNDGKDRKDRKDSSEGASSESAPASGPDD